MRFGMGGKARVARNRARGPAAAGVYICPPMHEQEQAPESSSLLAPALAVIGAVSALALGTSFAKSLFPLIGAQGTSALRITKIGRASCRERV